MWVYGIVWARANDTQVDGYLQMGQMTHSQIARQMTKVTVLVDKRHTVYEMFVLFGLAFGFQCAATARKSGAK